MISTNLNQVRQNWSYLQTQDQNQNSAGFNGQYSNDQRMLNQIRKEWGTDKIQLGELAGKGMDPNLAMLDFNKDGFLDASEMGAFFKFANVDGDDQTTDIEYQNAMEALTGKKANRQENGNKPNGPENDYQQVQNTIHQLENEIKRIQETTLIPLYAELDYRNNNTDTTKPYKNQKTASLSDTQIKDIITKSKLIIEQDGARIDQLRSQITRPRLNIAA